MSSAVFFGLLPGVRVAVDRFDSASLALVFLTHFHAGALPLPLPLPPSPSISLLSLPLMCAPCTSPNRLLDHYLGLDER